METTVDFFGPVTLYVRHQGGEWVVWADPFSEVGIAPTRDAAVAAAQKSVEDYLSLVAVEMRGDRDIRFFTPLSPAEKDGADEVCHFHLYSVKVLVADRAAPTRSERAVPPKLRPIEKVLDAIREHLPVRAGPVEPCMV